MSLPPRQRRTTREPALPHSYNQEEPVGVKEHSDKDAVPYQRSRAPNADLRQEFFFSWAVGAALTVLAFVIRFKDISHPGEVVFDEVHFGSFAAQYLRREYYFDVHPPLAKLLNGLAGWLAGFDGDFSFESIGDAYAPANVPYKGMRSFCAVLGSLTIPIVYAIMRESGYPVAIAAFSASLVLFDNGHITQSRLILLDAALILFMAFTLLAYVKFHQQRYREYTVAWWGWLFGTGLGLALTLGCKMVGLFTFFTIGAAVLWDLWNILDIRRGHTMQYFFKHFSARFVGLIVFPFAIYLFIFWIHFSILIYSGPGDTFMSPAFQETLKGNEMLLNSQEIRYLDTITVKHKDSKVFLHSHPDKYPLRYDDGRISSQGQQVTGYGHPDLNNHWQIIPTREIPETGRGRVVRQKDVVQFLHVATDSYLMTHDVASPLMATNQEFTTWPKDDYSRHNDTLFQLDVWDAHDGEPWQTKSGLFKLIHMPTRVCLWTHPERLPEWGFSQQEINGNKRQQDKSNMWFVDEIVADGSGHDFRNRTAVVEDKPRKHRNFFLKFFELQVLMLQHNAGLTASHPYASDPFSWPFVMSGISFWTSNTEKMQIYMIGNVASWWLGTLSMAIFAGIVGADTIARRRGLDPIEDPVRNRMLRSTGFFVGAWAFHYFPFYLMNRQTFLHHYLPAHLASTLVAGSVLNFILIETVNYPVSVAGLTTRLRPKVRARLGSVGLSVVALLMLAVIWTYWFLSPLTYGTPALNGDQVNRRKILSTWTLHFEGKKTHDVEL